MQRNIISTITFASEKVSIVVLEKISANVVELFNDFSNTKQVHNFLKTSLKNIEIIIGGKLSEVGVIIEPSSKMQADIQICHEEIQIVGHTVAYKDVENIIQLTKQQFKATNRKVILVQPVKFDVYDVITKSYNRAPIYKKGSKLSATSAVTYISMETYNYINQVIKSQGLNISQMLLTPQTTSQTHVSKAALASGSILINVGETQSFITINKNLSTVVLMSFYDFGYNNLLNGITKSFKCSRKEAHDIFISYGSVNAQNKKYVIYRSQNNEEKMVYYKYELEEIIKLFINKLIFIINKFLNQKNVTQLPIVFSGKLKAIIGIKKYLKDIMENELVSIYNPLSFVENNKTNINTLGFSNFMNALDEILGKKFNTIVETNPNLISSFIKQGKINQTWYEKIINKIGGKYEWN